MYFRENSNVNKLLIFSLENNSTIEERVAVLEFQVSTLTNDVIDLGEDLNLVEVEQAVQDERILELQMDSEGKTSRKI